LGAILKLFGADVLVKFEKKCNCFFYNWGQLGANVLVEFKNAFLIGTSFFQFGGNWGKLGANGGKCVSGI